MSFIGICICLIIGLLELIIGVITKMKWLKIVALIDLKGEKYETDSSWKQ